MIEICKSSTVQ